MIGVLVIDELAEPSQAARRLALHGADRTLHGRGRLRLRQLIEVAKDQYGALAGGQCEEASDERVANRDGGDRSGECGGNVIDILSGAKRSRRIPVRYLSASRRDPSTSLGMTILRE